MNILPLGIPTKSASIPRPRALQRRRYVAALAPRGVLRAAINLSNFLLVSDQTGATPRGISPSLCGALAQRLEVPLELVPYANPGLLADAATSDEWDVGLIGAEPARANWRRLSEEPACT